MVISRLHLLALSRWLPLLATAAGGLGYSCWPRLVTAAGHDCLCLLASSSHSVLVLDAHPWCSPAAATARAGGSLVAVTVLVVVSRARSRVPAAQCLTVAHCKFPDLSGLCVALDPIDHPFSQLVRPGHSACFHPPQTLKTTIYLHPMERNKVARG